jgi:glycosyltransferase involved in cell wall biosynthesis
VHVLVDAVRGLPRERYELKIFGDVRTFPDYVARLRDQASGLPVAFMGHFDRDHVADAYAQVDVLVVPSLWLENSPLVIHEAFLCGVPVVGARIGGIADLIDHDRNGLLYDPTSAGALEEALRGLIARRERVRELAAACPPVKPIAQDAREWEQIYEHLLASRRAAGPA